ncbi:MAG: hypothetical protein MR867_02940 [Eubacterium sp.]|nr:hypothetical protein [Eubacterium sp.]MDD7210576.1 hypothetical protein [Lachnospiraceae bacterium]MDY5498320.1 hypothetical protein [Anaerobutyricum sp.]
MPTIYLHIGTPKTGTTALQNFLPVNEEILNKHGICYPDLGFRYPGVGVHRNAHFLVTTCYKDEQGNRMFSKEQEDYKKGIEQLKEIGKKFSTIILSDEGIWRQSILDRNHFWETLKKDLDEAGFDLKIIVYFRRQDLFVQSHWAQKIKEGAQYDFHQYLTLPVFLNYPLDYYSYMRHLADIVGKDSLILRVFEKQQFRGENHTIQEDFLDIFGLKMEDGFVVEQAVYNTSFEGDYLEMKKILNHLPEFKNNRNFLISSMKKIQDQKLFEENYKKVTFFEEGEQQQFMERFDESNSKLAREFFGREDGRLFYDDIKDYPVYKIDPEQLLVDTILVYGQVINSLNQKCEECRHTIEYLSKEVEKQKKKMEEIEKTALLFRIRRKWRHITGQDKKIKV